MVLIPATALAVLLACAATLVRPRWDVAVLTGLLAAIWSRVNGPVEGRVLHEFTPGRGFTEADIVSVVALAIAVTGLLRCTTSALRRSDPRGVHQGP
ncbi:hypothetical protein CLV92_11715 [Kineococcus xinjiangensis]|uniref:Uncharacterized protein n=1 Tax=Kineococcus xinjiangensis TaxID=512762 RepID=A0A2S6ICV6_9ACTN|nr:hypothetical protein [Kineococcus xinjiangensis]PPK92052.1 hypothetical protein CLV92_11715 [Kineococcus xinjiangensis]